MNSVFDTSHRPEIGIAEPLTEGLAVVTAPNASQMTFTGTRSYILGEGEVAIIDPGPDDPAHFDALVRVISGRRLSHVIVTHSHVDHSPLAKRLSKRFDAPVYAFGPSHAGRSKIMEKLAKQGSLGGGEGIDAGFSPDFTLLDEDWAHGKEWSLQAIHTPGHLSNHLCFAWDDKLFSGDHVMGWSSTLVSPPDGDLTQFMQSMRKLQLHKADTYYPGHGAPLNKAKAMLEYQINHRLQRENQILQALFDAPRDITELTAVIYAEIDNRLWPAAGRNILAHLIDLIQRGKVLPIGDLRASGQFQLV